MKVVLVHGASHQILQLARERGVKITNSDVTGVTDTATLDVSGSTACFAVQE
jgi:acetylglutamate kinase